MIRRVPVHRSRNPRTPQFIGPRHEVTFGHRRFYCCMRIAAAYRRLPRPSSAPKPRDPPPCVRVSSIFGTLTRLPGVRAVQSWPSVHPACSIFYCVRKIIIHLSRPCGIRKFHFGISCIFRFRVYIYYLYQVQRCFCMSTFWLNRLGKNGISLIIA